MGSLGRGLPPGPPRIGVHPPPHVYGVPPSWTPPCLWAPSPLDPPTFMGTLPPGPPLFMGSLLPGPPPCLWGPYGLPNECPPPQIEAPPSRVYRAPNWGGVFPLHHGVPWEGSPTWTPSNWGSPPPPHIYGVPPSWTPPTFMGSLPPGPPPVYGVPMGPQMRAPLPKTRATPPSISNPASPQTPMGVSHLSSVGWAASWGPCGGAAGGPWGVPGGPCGAADPPSPPSSGGPDPRLEVSIGDPSRALLTAVSASESSARSGDREAGKWGAETPNGGRIPSMGPKPHKWRPNPIYGAQTPPRPTLMGGETPNGGRIPSMGSLGLKDPKLTLKPLKLLC